MEYDSAEELVTATIGSGTSLSNGVNLQRLIDPTSGENKRCGLRLFGFIMPSGWDSAALTVLASYDAGTTWGPMKSLYDGTEITYVVNASGFFPLPNPQIFAAAPMIKIQSGTSASRVDETADRAIQLVLRSM